MEHKARFLQFVLSSNKPISISSKNRFIEGENQIIKILFSNAECMIKKITYLTLHCTFSFGNKVENIFYEKSLSFRIEVWAQI